MGLTRTPSPSKSFAVLMCCMHVVVSYFIFVLYENVFSCVVFVLYDDCKNKNKERKQMMCCIFPRVERALVFSVIFFPFVESSLVLLCCIFSAGNTPWRYCVIFSACGMRSDVIMLFSPHVERDLALLY